MPVKLAVVCEAEGDYITATSLAERILCADVEWVDADFLRSCPLWWGEDQQIPYLRWKEIGKVERKLGLPKPKGFFGEQPAASGDAQMARRALIVLRRLHPDLNGVLLLRDEDRDPDRREGLEQARRESPICNQIVIGLARAERECWVLAGFDPCTEEEQKLLDEMRQKLGFDPRFNAERLNTRRDHHRLSAKRVLRELTMDDPTRETRCWTDTSLNTLRQRGQGSGLAKCLDEITQIFTPLIAQPKRGRP